MAPTEDSSFRSPEVGRAYVFFYGLAGALALYVAVLDVALGPYVERQQHAYRTSRGLVDGNHPLFHEINGILFPGYDIEAVLAERDLHLYAFTKYADPTVVLADGTLTSVVVPVPLLLHLVANDPPDVLFLGSSRAREAFRPDVFVDHLQRLGGPRVRALNLAVSAALPEVHAIFAEHLVRVNRRRFPVIVVMNDDFSMDVVERRKREARNNGAESLRRRYESMLKRYLGNSEPGLRPAGATLPAVHHFLSVTDPFARPVRPALPADLGARYAAWEGRYVAETPPHHWRLDPPAADAFERALRDLLRIADEVVVLTSPVTDARRNIFDQEAARRVLRGICERVGATCLDHRRQDWQLDNTHYFHRALNRQLAYVRNTEGFEPTHLNPLGAVRFSTSLAEQMVELVD